MTAAPPSEVDTQIRFRESSKIDSTPSGGSPLIWDQDDDVAFSNFTKPFAVPAQTLPYLIHTYGYIGSDAVRDRVTRYFRPRQS